MSERFIEVPGGRLAVRDTGSGPAILLLHAAIVDSRAWEPLTLHLLEAGYRVVAFDRRGSGASTTRDEPFSNRADTIAVLDAMGIERAALVGNSVGGQIAIDTAVEHPDRIVAVVTIGANISGWFPDPPPAEQALWEEEERLDAEGDAEAIAEFDLRVWVDGPGQPADRVPAEMRELVRRMDLANHAPGRVSGQPIPLDPPAAARLDRLEMPVLAVAGGLDVSDVAATAEYLASHAPQASAVVMPDVAHLIALEAPAALGVLITQFLAPLPRWA